MSTPRTPASAFAARRRALASRLGRPALIASGLPRARNYRANAYPFRATSHFLYLVGASIPGAALLVTKDRADLFAPLLDLDDAIWHGPQPTFETIREAHGLDAVRPVGELDEALRELGRENLASLPTEDAESSAWLAGRICRAVAPSAGDKLAEGSPDVELAEAMIAIRLRHDDAAADQLRAAGEASAEAHLVGMRATRGARHEWEVAAAMVGELHRRGLGESYSPIVTIHGEVLHNHGHENPIQPGDLLLADVGGETPEGWAGDITRTWPVSGTFSPTQRAIYEVVLAAQKAAVSMVKKGTSYRSIHEKTARAMVTGLKGLGIFKGDVDGLCERGAGAIFFPHGVGHLIGLDVHDMEDLGDRAGYAKGRARSKRFGDAYLRLDRELEPGMAVTIEPGFYHVPGILASEAITGAVGRDLDREVLARFADVRGIRIEDDVLCTEGEPEVLTRRVPKEVKEVEAVMAEGRG